MRALLRFFIRQHNIILFLSLEFLCILLTIRYNDYQHNISFNFFKEFTGSIHQLVFSVTKYIGTVEENVKLAEENAKLRTIINQYTINDTVRIKKDNINDFIPAKVVYANINTANNYLVIDKGSKDSILPDMGVISPNGVVGIVKDVSENFATVLPIINVNAHVSARIKTNDYFGTTIWDGKNSTQINLADIPYHVKLKIGDTVITSGFSTIFPEGIEIGTISSFDYNEGNDFYNIVVKLFTDFRKIKYVYIVRNKHSLEFKTLEQRLKNEQ
ncbi:MAG: rod shape-determining protein MreC [Bacteroidales bacterium]|nr:rod shape-determining protein MreC [Bacteroidales bacterium]